MIDSVLAIPVKTIEGRPTTLEEYRGRVLLVVNVASKCGLTPQYTQLESLYQAKHAAGLEILGFPANDFMGQEPGSEAEIATFHREFLARLEGGQTIGHALTALARWQENPDFEWVLTDIVANLAAGQPFTEALSGHPQTFDKEYIALWEDIDKRKLDLPRAIEVLRDYDLEALSETA